MLNPYMVVDGSVPSVEAWSGLQAGLQRRDVITAINGVTLPSDDIRLAPTNVH